MKLPATYFSLLLLTVLFSCGTPQTLTDLETPNGDAAPFNNEEEESVEEVVAVTPPPPPVQEGPRKAVGAFRSVKGVMDPLSCYCSNGGYLDSPAGEVVPICFDNNVEISSRDYLEVTGVMTTRTIDANGACPSGTLTYLIVESYKLEP